MGFVALVNKVGAHTSIIFGFSFPMLPSPKSSFLTLAVLYTLFLWFFHPSTWTRHDGERILRFPRRMKQCLPRSVFIHTLGNKASRATFSFLDSRFEFSTIIKQNWSISLFQIVVHSLVDFFALGMKANKIRKFFFRNYFNLITRLPSQSLPLLSNFRLHKSINVKHFS